MTPEEKNLKERALSYEAAYFEDFTFKPGSIAGDVLLYSSKNIMNPSRSKACRYYEPCEHEPWVQTSIDRYSFKIKDLGECGGRCEGGCIIIHPERVDSRETLLHEMIHAYENQLREPLQQLLSVRLYTKLKTDRKLKRQIDNLDYTILKQAHVDEYIMFGGSRTAVHGTLFFLKCIDLENRLKLPLGTIYGY